mmetsp:Transcript_17293/g.25345  ORF Transcript_17293/g.25345 Transcript_17293/m.25345 type:complete len:82 (+) Transcript_17293:218-463(+)
MFVFTPEAKKKNLVENKRQEQTSGCGRVRGRREILPFTLKKFPAGITSSSLQTNKVLSMTSLGYLASYFSTFSERKSQSLS